MKNLLQILGQINEWVGRAISWLTLVLVLVVCVYVIRRYLLDATSIWLEELIWHIYALIFLLGAGYAMKHDRHVRVDLFYARYSKRDQLWTNLLGNLLFLVPWCLVIIFTSFHFAAEAWENNEGSSNSNGLPYRYLIKGAITVGFSLLLLQALLQIGDAIAKLRQNPEAETPSEIQ